MLKIVKCEQGFLYEYVSAHTDKIITQYGQYTIKEDDLMNKNSIMFKIEMYDQNVNILRKYLKYELVSSFRGNIE